MIAGLNTRNNNYPALPILPGIEEFLETYAPGTGHYFNPLNAVFSPQILSPKLLAKNREWLLRDGLLPLLHFFKMFPNPDTVESTLIVPLKFASAVPRSWKKQTQYYELVQLKNETSFKTLFIPGISGAKTDHLETLIERISKCSSKLTGLHHVFLIRPQRPSSADEAALIAVDRAIFSLIGIQAREMNWQEFLSLRHSTTSAFLNFLNDWMIYDDFGTHLGASRGFFQLELPSVKQLSEIQIPLSPYHGLNVYDSASQGQKILSREVITKASNHPTYLQHSWSRLFTRWQ